MSNLTSVINVNVPTNVKKEANILFEKLGLNMSTAINMFLKKSIKENGIPFDLKLDNEKELNETKEELRKMENHELEYKKFKDVSSLMKDLDN